MNDKMQIYWAKQSEWMKERDEAALSFDVNKFKKFYIKWRVEGIYTRPLPEDDFVIEIAMRQMVLGMANPPKDKVAEAKAWLKAHGFSTNPWR